MICHRDLHPFNLLVDGEHWSLIDWSAAVIADPHDDLAFTTPLLANPPLDGPAPVRAAAHAIGNQPARRFLRTCSCLSGTRIDPARIQWGRHVHALRGVVEITTWQHEQRIDAHSGHPWLTLRPLLEGQSNARSA